MKVLEIAPRYAPAVGGTETHVKEVATRLAGMGVEVVVLTTDTSGELPSREVRDGVVVERVRAWPRARDYYLAPGLLPRLLRRDYDVAHCQSYQTLVPLVAMAALLLAGKPYVVTTHRGGTSSTIRKMMRWPQLMLLYPFLRRAKRIICVGTSEYEYFARTLRLPKERFTIIPNGLDMTGLVPVARSRPNPEPVFVCSARFEKYKGQHRVLRGFAAYVERYKKGQLRLVGHGPYEGRLRALAGELGVSDRVEFTSFSPDNRSALSELVGTADLFMLLSESEAHSVAVLEAIALGVPVLVANTSGLADVVAAGLAQGVALDCEPDDLASVMDDMVQSATPPPPSAIPTWDCTAADNLGVYNDVVGASVRDNRQSIA